MSIFWQAWFTMRPGSKLQAEDKLSKLLMLLSSDHTQAFPRFYAFSKGGDGEAVGFPPSRVWVCQRR